MSKQSFQQILDSFTPGTESKENNTSSDLRSPPVQPPPGDAGSNTGGKTPGRHLGNIERGVVLDLVDSMQRPPPNLTADYIAILTRTASWLKTKQPGDPEIGNTGSKPAWGDTSYPEEHKGITKGFVGSNLDAQEKARNEASRIRNDIFEIVNRVNAFVSRAKNAGFLPPENPFSLAMSFNVGRTGFGQIYDHDNAFSRITTNIQSYLTLLSAEATGRLNLDQRHLNAAQLSSANFSLDGYGGTGDTSLDLAKLLPDADSIKSQKAFEALSVFDFTKRIPKVLFTAFYAPDGVPAGVIVGWKKVPDASGYVIRRKNIFDDKEVVYSVSSDDIRKTTARLKEYVNAWILSFYDNVQEDFVYDFLDTDVPPHAYFFYKLQAYQLQNESPGAMFATATSPVFLSQSQKELIRAELEKLDPNAKRGLANSSVDKISPYPVLSHFLFGNSKYDWLLSAINIRQSINRNDTRTTTRNYSYLSAQLDFLFAQSDNGKLVVPMGKDVSLVLRNIEIAISKYGVNQVIKETLQETGALYHFEGKDANDNDMFKNVDTQQSANSGLVSVVASAIDPENATLNLRTLAANLPQLLSGDFINSGQDTKRGTPKPKTAVTSEIEIPSEFDKPSDQYAEDEIQYLRQLDDLSSDIAVDLTTVDGLSVFMRVIRIFSDIGPGRGTPITSEPRVVIPDPVSIPPEPPPAPSSTQPYRPPAPQPTGAPPRLGKKHVIDAAADAARAEAQAEAREAEAERIADKNDVLTGKGKGGAD